MRRNSLNPLPLALQACERKRLPCIGLRHKRWRTSGENPGFHLP
jgi:hypothetical protein